MQQHIESLEGRRLMAAGDLDASFGEGGVARVDLIAGERSATSVEQLVVDAAGRTLVLTQRGGAVRVSRLTADGQPDARFAVAAGGVLTLDVSELAAQTGMAPHLATDATNRVYALSDTVLRRYTSSGKLDRTFGRRGRITLTGLDTGGGLAIDQANRPWVVGTADSHIAVMRLTSDGDLDTAFSGDGVYEPPRPGTLSASADYSSFGRFIRVLTDGSVVAAGDVDQPGPAIQRRHGVQAIKFVGNDVDRSYGRRGVREYYRPDNDDTENVEVSKPIGIRGDGTVVMLLVQNGQDSNPTITPAGRDGGAVNFGFGSTLVRAQFVRQSDGREIVLDRATSRGDGENRLLRLNANNSVDATFNGGEPVRGVSAVTAANDGSVLLGATGKRVNVARVFGSEGPAGRLVPTTLVAPSRELPFRVVFRDDDGVNAASITAQVLRVIAPDDTSTRPVLTGLSESNGNVIADFVYRPADRKLNAEDNGVFAVRLLGGRALDVNGNAAEARTLGSIVVRIT